MSESIHAVCGVSAPFFSKEARGLLLQIMGEQVPLIHLQTPPYAHLHNEYFLSSEEIGRVIDFARAQHLLQEDAHGLLHYTHLHFSVLLLQLEEYYASQSVAHRYLTSTDLESIFSDDFFQASLYYLQRIFHILLRRERRALAEKPGRILLLRLMSQLWLSVFETLPAFEQSSLPLLQLYFVLRDNHYQFEVAYFRKQLQTSPYLLEVLSLFSWEYSRAQAGSFPIDLLTFAKNIGLSPTDTSLLWSAVRDLMRLVGGCDPRIAERLSLLREDFQRTASIIFLQIKNEDYALGHSWDGMLFSETTEEEQTPLTEIAAVCKEIEGDMEEYDPVDQGAFFVFIGASGRGQRDAARALRYQLSQIEGWRYTTGYYEWDVQKLLHAPCTEWDARLARYPQGAIYFYNFPPLVMADQKEEVETFRVFLQRVSENLLGRMYIFDFVSPTYIQHYLPVLESLPLWVIHFPAYSKAYLKHHFKQLGIMAEVDIEPTVYIRLGELYEKAAPLFAHGIAADLFVYQLFAESLQKMSLRVKENDLRSEVRRSSAITAEDLRVALNTILHL